MIPKIRKPNQQELKWNKDIKWVVEAKHEYKDIDLCYSLSSAIRFWLWHCGVSPKIAFGWFRKRREEDE